MTELLTVISLIFIVAGPFLLLANYLRLPTAPALILAGVAVSGFVDETIKLEIARLGIALLVFTFAVRIQTTDIQSAIADSEVIALGQLVIVGVCGSGIGLLLGLPFETAIYLGIAAGLSSSIVGSTLFLPGHHELVHDRLSESIHSIQDFVGLFILLVVSAGVFAIDPIATQLGLGVILLLAAIVINRYLFQLIGRISGGNAEPMLVGTVALLLAFLGVSDLIGVSPIVGAFAAGVAVNHDPVEYASVINGIESINDFFAAIFFLTVGALVTVPTTDVVIVTVVLVLLAGVIKPAVTIALLMYKGYERRTATLTGFNLDQIGELALIIAIEAFFLGLLVSSIFEAIILAAAVTMITSSFTRYYDEPIYHVLADRGLLGRHGRSLERHSTVPPDLTDHVVIVGYGRHGRRLIEVCESQDQPYVVIESNPALREDLQSNCAAYVYGDVIEQRTVEKARIRSARIVVSTVDSRPVSERLVAFSTDVDVILRTKGRPGAVEFLDRGAIYVGVSDLLAADCLDDQLESLLDSETAREAMRAEWFDSMGTYRKAPERSADD